VFGGGAGIPAVAAAAAAGGGAAGDAHNGEIAAGVLQAMRAIGLADGPLDGERGDAQV